MRNVTLLGGIFVATVLVAAIVSLSATPLVAQQRAHEHAVDDAHDSELPHRSAATEEGCALRKGVRRTVTAIVDAETVKLDDGSVVRLVGALTPSAMDAGQENAHWPLAIEARAFLQTLILGKTVQLAHADIGLDRDNTEDSGGRRARDRPKPAERDRYGRILAHLFLGDNVDTRVWVQAALLRAGLARAYGLPGNDACLREMILHEATARRSRLGLWVNRLYRIKRAEPGRSLMRLRNRFELVRGEVSNVTVTRTATYINFGADWRRDFTIRIDKALRAKHAAWSRVLPALKGKTVIVRGWIERRNGPEIKLWSPDQIEIEKNAAEQSASSRRRSGPEFEGDDHAPTPDDAASDAAGTLAPHQDAARDIDPPKTKPARPNIDSNAPAGFDL